MLFESGKMNQIAFQSEGRYSIPNLLLRVRCRFSNRNPYLFKNHLNVIWEAADVPVYIVGSGSLSFDKC